MHYQKQVCLLLIASAAACNALAAAYQPLTSIQAAAEQHVRQLLPNTAGVLHLQAETLDSRLHLAQCVSPLQAFLPNGANLGRRATVGVRCDSGPGSNNGWSVYVPVNIESEINVLSLNKSLARDAVITLLDLDSRKQRVPGLSNQYLKDMSELQGKRLKRDLPAGTVLTASMLQPQLLIRRGQTVTLLAEAAGIAVRNQGIALADGSSSARIQVRNLSSAKVVEGVVDAQGVVRVPL
jgi:flagella basal body P-ring formation protein FlgA